MSGYFDAKASEVPVFLASLVKPSLPHSRRCMQLASALVLFYKYRYKMLNRQIVIITWICYPLRDGAHVETVL